MTLVLIVHARNQFLNTVRTLSIIIIFNKPSLNVLISQTQNMANYIVQRFILSMTLNVQLALSFLRTEIFHSDLNIFIFYSRLLHGRADNKECIFHER